MEKIFVLKKGKIVITRSGRFVIRLANSLLKTLKPLSKKIQIAGSIRRKSENPVDIDIVLIPKDKDKIFSLLSKKGRCIEHGEKQTSFRIKGIKVELYYANKVNWGAMLLSYTGPSGYQIGLRKITKKRGLLLNQYGLFKNKKRIAGKTEKSIYQTLGKHYKPPRLR